jgi:hypothetical protein
LAEEDTMADALAQTLSHPAEALAQAQAGRALVLETYAWDVLANKLDTVWERMRLGETARITKEPREVMR